jgi:hypothetical protein
MLGGGVQLGSALDPRSHIVNAIITSLLNLVCFVQQWLSTVALVFSSSRFSSSLCKLVWISATIDVIASIRLRSSRFAPATNQSRPHGRSSLSCPFACGAWFSSSCAYSRRAPSSRNLRLRSRRAGFCCMYGWLSGLCFVFVCWCFLLSSLVDPVQPFGSL